MTEENETPEKPEPPTAAAPQDASEAVLDTLWQRVLEAWDDDKPHHALLEYAIQAQKLPDVAGRYRQIKDRDTEKAARAQKKLDGIVIAATHLLMAMKSPPDKYKIPPAVNALIFAVTLLGLALLMYAVFHRR